MEKNAYKTENVLESASIKDNGVYVFHIWQETFHSYIQQTLR